MKLVFRQYLASLCERRELDAILPDLLSELGFNVISRPSIGTRQYGVDVAAVGKGSDGKRKFYLFSIKQGDLTRADWDGTPQALRSSINEILDVYVPTRIPKAYEKLSIVICLCFGGDILEAVRDNVTLFTNSRATQKISFEEWNGDYIAGLMIDGVLKEQLVDKAMRTCFQKAVAMVDEPDIAFQHFSVLVRRLCATVDTKPRERVLIIRQIYICLWVFFVWARDAGNIEGPYRASELAVLHTWCLVRNDISKATKSAEEVCLAYHDLGALHDLIWDTLIGEKILPHISIRHGIAAAVRSEASVDVNIKLFELLGRVAMRGLWLLWSQSGSNPLPAVIREAPHPDAVRIGTDLAALIKNNQMLLSPFTDDQAIDICAALIFLSMIPVFQDVAAQYVEALIQRVIYAYRTHNVYPTIHGAYRDLVAHPRERSAEYQESQTRGSTLIPILSLWASALGVKQAAEYLATFDREHFNHSNTQLWFPNDQSEHKIYVGENDHGATLSRVPITDDAAEAFEILNTECSFKSPFNALSAVRFGHWPLVAMACRHYRLPLPPNLWFGLLQECRAEHP